MLVKNKRKQFEKKLEDIKENEDHSTKIKELNNQIRVLKEQLTKKADEIKGKENQISDLEQKLKDSIDNEDYESASKIRDEIKRRSGN